MKNHKAARFYGANEPLRVEEAPSPRPGENEVLVHVKACGICGTDLHILHGVLPTAYTPIILGHEIAGEAEGERVMVYPQELCGTCPYCQRGQENLCLRPKVFGMQRDGGMAELVAVPAANLLPLPQGVPCEIGAILADAVATPYHAILRRGALQQGERVAVFGCGGLGYHAIKLCRLLGAASVIAVDMEEASLRRAEEAGATAVIHSRKEDPVQKIKRLVKGGVDLSLEFVGLSQTIAQAVQSVRRGGRAVVCGIGMEPMRLPPPFAFVGNEISLLGSFGSTKEDIKRVLALVAEGTLDLSSSITNRFPLEKADQALQDLHSRRGHPVRLVIQPSA